MDELIAFVQHALAQHANADNAAKMAAYLKTDMPFYGVKRPELKPVAQELKRRFKPTDQAEYQRAILALWTLPHREEKYLALALARQHWRLLTAETVPVIERLIREGAWWDFVDEIAAHLMGRVLKRDASQLAVLDRWITDEDVWVRRAAVISQLRTMLDPERLFHYCRMGASDESFWMRKAIGWALRDHADADPEAVVRFLRVHGTELSKLSQREAARKLIQRGLLEAEWAVSAIGRGSSS